MTPLSSVRDPETGFTKITYFVDAKLGDFDGLVLQVVASEEGAGVMVAPEKHITDVMDGDLIGKHNAIAGATLTQAFHIPRGEGSPHSQHQQAEERRCRDDGGLGP